ncbi:Bax inhibitor-1/YccA family protein [Salegentibacter chungangensis]|uniref:Bax inhibitor-1/YccA family protein n=1 Tax=Salegentibacter chungangensis TaxID=1335724 RepID=A0ABW3NS51_9FLAO
MESKPLISESIKADVAGFINKVYNWMALALLITGLVAWTVASTPEMAYAIVSNQILFFGLLIAEVLLVGYISGAINKLSSQTAILLFLLYSALNGLTLSVIFLAYTAGSIATTFFICAGTFTIMSIYGYTTKTDLTRLGNLAFMALIGLIIASIVNFFLKSEMLYWIVTYVGVLIFVGLVAYDTQKIKRIGEAGFEAEEQEQKSAVLGALSLYLDFINLFLFLLRIFGRRK